MNRLPLFDVPVKIFPLVILKFPFNDKSRFINTFPFIDTSLRMVVFPEEDATKILLDALPIFIIPVFVVNRLPLFDVPVKIFPLVILTLPFNDKSL